MTSDNVPHSYDDPQGYRRYMEEYIPQDIKSAHALIRSLRDRIIALKHGQ